MNEREIARLRSLMEYEAERTEPPPSRGCKNSAAHR